MGGEAPAVTGPHMQNIKISGSEEERAKTKQINSLPLALGLSLAGKFPSESACFVFSSVSPLVNTAKKHLKVHSLTKIVLLAESTVSA